MENKQAKTDINRSSRFMVIKLEQTPFGAVCPSGKDPRRSGFTLIELLVVVLIIGILAAVALPQYNLAVAKSRFVQAMALGDKLWQAEQIYFMENGSYTTKLDELVFDMPGGYTNKTSYSITYSWGRCVIDAGNYCEGYCSALNGKILFKRNFKNAIRHCRAYDDFSKKVCKSLGGTNKATGSDYTQYDLP